MRVHQVINSFSMTSATGPSAAAASWMPASISVPRKCWITAFSSSSLLGKYRYSVPLETPAALATSSLLVAAKPFSTNSVSAASSSSAGRASLRRRRNRQGSEENGGIALMTRWSLMLAAFARIVSAARGHRALFRLARAFGRGIPGHADDTQPDRTDLAPTQFRPARAVGRAGGRGGGRRG